MLALRLVSAVASLVSFGAIASIVFGETKSWFWGLASAGFFAGLYPASRFWYDLARVDSVFVMFFLLFLFSLLRTNSIRWQMAAGIFAALTLLTKQNGLLMCVPVIGLYFLFDWKRRWVLPVTFTLVYGLISLALILSTSGWYLYYCFTMVFLKPTVRMDYKVFDFIQSFIFPYTSGAALSGLFVIPFLFLHGKKERSLLWLVILSGVFVTSYLAKANIGGVNNVVIPTFAILSLLFGMGLAEISTKLQAKPARARAIAEIFFCILAVLQLVQIIYNPSVAMPPFEDYLTGSKALKFVKKFDGNVYLPNSSVLLMAGKKSFAHPSAIWDVLHSDPDLPGRDILLGELKTAVASHLFDAIVIMPGFEDLPDLPTYYVHDRSKYFLLDDYWKEKADVYVLPEK